MQGQWDRSFLNSDDIPELYRRTIGLVGFGAVAQLVAKYLDAFGCRLLAFDPYFKGDPAPAVLRDLLTLLRESDVVSLHARLSAETQHLIGAKELALMKPSVMNAASFRSVSSVCCWARSLQERFDELCQLILTPRGDPS
jgi:D-3-phosphoglycerate dehydrogenase